MTERIQDTFWSEEYAQNYARKNSGFNNELGREGWGRMLAKAELHAKNFLEIGCNIGRNLDQLKLLDPEMKGSVVEISPEALAYVQSRHKLERQFCGPVQEAQFPLSCFELVFTSGVLIHVPPTDLLTVMEQMFAWSSKYVLMAEYFNRTPISIDYQGRSDLLFKCDFGGMFMDHFPVNLVDYGFLWGRIYDVAGFDDITWWLFEKGQP